MDQMFPTPGPELPKPQHIEAQQSTGEYVVPFPEKLEHTAPGERLSQASSAVAQAADDAAVIPIIIPGTQADDTNGSTQGIAPGIADDADVIEKEWVAKAKDIVSKTKNDPHLQSAELTNFRHDYMKKRYGKEIMLPDDRTV